jgi:glucose/arabinose dehydrogenase
MKPSISHPLSSVRRLGAPRAALWAFVFGVVACSSAGPRSSGGNGGSDEGGAAGSDEGGKGGSSGGGKGGSSSGGKGGATGGSGGDSGGSGGDSGGSGGASGGSGGATGGKGGKGGSGGATGGAGGDTGGSGGATGGSGGATGGAGGTNAAACSTMPAMTPPALKRGMMIGGFSGQAGQVVAVPGETNVMYVIGHTNGNLYTVMDGKVQPQPLLNVSVAGNGNGPEQGFLSVAFHPQFATNHLLYVFYTASGGGDITVDEFERMSPTTAMFKQNIHKHKGSNQYHNGGTIYFSPKDDKPLLYHSVGNAQNEANSASPTSLNGKILRYDVGTKMGVPAMGATGFTFAYGLRNPYRMSVDRLTGDVWIGDVGDGQGGSIFFIPQNKGSVTNFGYGNGNEVAGGISGFQGGGAAIIGGVVYRGSKIPGLCGRYFFGMHSSGAVKSMIQMGGQRVGGIVDHPTLTVPGKVSSFGEDGEGEIWMSSMANNAIFRIEAGQ